MEKPHWTSHPPGTEIKTEPNPFLPNIFERIQDLADTMQRCVLKMKHAPEDYQAFSEAHAALTHLCAEHDGTRIGQPIDRWRKVGKSDYAVAVYEWAKGNNKFLQTIYDFIGDDDEETPNQGETE